MPPDPRRTVFVGNIAYGLAEETLMETLGRVGHVVNWRLVLDKDTGKPKGFGFAEYQDHDSAASAVRNLNDTEFMGRKLRVDWSNDNDRPQQHGGEGLNNHGDAGMNGQSQPVGLPAIPPGAELPPGVSAPDAISQTLMTLTPAQLLDIISQMKGLVMSDPAQAIAILKSQPQFAYAIFQALLILELVNTSKLSSILQPQPGAPPQAATPLPQPILPVQPPPSVQPPPMPLGYPPQPQYPPPPLYQQPYMSQPPLAPQYQQLPPQMHQPPPQTQVPPPQDQQAALIQQVLSMAEEVVVQLPPEQRQQINALRIQYGARAY